MGGEELVATPQAAGAAWPPQHRSEVTAPLVAWVQAQRAGVAAAAWLGEAGWKLATMGGPMRATCVCVWAVGMVAVPWAAARGGGGLAPQIAGEWVDDWGVACVAMLVPTLFTHVH